MNISFKAAYLYDPNDKRDLKTVKEIRKNVSPTMDIIADYSPDKKILLTEEVCSRFQKYNDSFTFFSHDEGVPIDLIKYTETYEKVNFNIVKKALLSVGRKIKQII